ncbi:MAG: NCS2 family permease [Bacilli bacterium]|nr:NCS2 family permease [Bacilli bacterium]
MKFFNKLFHLEERQASIKNEIIGGLVTFIAMCYILPINSMILSSTGMSAVGVFIATAILSFIVTMIMGLVANYPIMLSAGMGINTYVAYTLSESFGSWQARMILMTIVGLCYFTLSLTPIRKKIIEVFPKNLKCIISAALGAFILFVGLKGSGIIVSRSSTLVSLGNFADPAMLIAVISIILTIGLMFSSNKTIRTMAIPFGILFAAVAGLIASCIMKETGALAWATSTESDVYAWRYQFGNLEGTITTLPTAPWYSENIAYNHVSWGINFGELKNVLFFGSLVKDNGGKYVYTASQFGNDLIKVFTNPVSYVAIFSMIFVNIFDNAATLITTGEKTGAIDENGKVKNYRKATLADATGALICGPLGSSTVTSFVESNVSISVGAKTGMAACITAIMFLLSSFIYPLFFVFTAGSVTASALVCVGLLIVTTALTNMDLKDLPIAFTAVIAILFAVLCYSISTGIGFGLIAYCTMMIVSGRRKEVGITIYILAALFIVAFSAETIVNSI